MNDKQTKTYYIRTVNATLYFNVRGGTVYFDVRGGTVYFDGKATHLLEYKLYDFLAMAKEMGMVTGTLNKE